MAAPGFATGHRTVISVDCPKIEDALKDPVKWNAEWERAMDPSNHFTPIDFYEADIRLYAIRSKEYLDASYVIYPVLVRQTLELQVCLLQDIFTFRSKGFDDKWLRADPSLHEKHVLVGLSRACSGAHNLHYARRLCPTELNITYLTKDGHYFLNLLKSVIPEDVSHPPTRLAYFSHLDWDDLRAYHERSSPHDLEKLCYQTMLILRTKLISIVLRTTFRSFFDLVLPNITLLKGHNEARLFEPLKTKTLVPPGATLRRAGCHLETCPNGMHGAVDVTKEMKFQRCRECWEKLGREIKYCSRECQKSDWKPNHKAICGKPFDFDMVDKIAAASDSAPVPTCFTPVVGPAVAGFKRSTGLSYIISRTCLRPLADYLIMPTLETEIAVDFLDAEVKKMFRVFREKAFTTGDREAVAVMAHGICWWASFDSCETLATPDVVVAQLRVEFQFESLKRLSWT
ncbi:hypothetical protein C8R44DRAFT_733119 [Mycena epipterygia]|nr:hypothetical protein C8R44DRAFT_733119 [Mycena epipterygia]